jgi:hypothetical protein
MIVLAINFIIYTCIQIYKSIYSVHIESKQASLNEGRKWLMDRVAFLTQALKLFLFGRHIKTGSVAHPASHSLGEFSLMQRRSECEDDNSS